MKKIVEFAVGSALVAALGAAQAATFDLGQLENSDVIANKLTSGSSFLDVYNFSLSSTSSLTLDLNQNGLGTSLSFSLYSGTLSSIPGTGLLGSGDKSTDLTVSSLSSGKYTLFVAGDPTGNKGDYYKVALNVAAVPEPESYAMLLAGLGVMGAVARRRKKQA